jgi:SAM-dependent methyltransferase
MTHAVVRQGVLGAFRVLNRGTAYECPCCESTFARFVRRGSDSLCPRCRSIARNRVLVLYLSRHPETLPPGARVLHLAPEPAVHRWLSRRRDIAHTTADLRRRPLVDLQFDAHDVPFPEASFDLVLCSHVLEHVRDDVKVLRELGRVVRPRGRVLIQIPVRRTLEATDDDPTVVEPADRLERFGQHDHVRRHGRDVCERLAQSGLVVERIRYEDLAGEDERRRFILTDASEHRGMRSGDVYCCRHPA